MGKAVWIVPGLTVAILLLIGLSLLFGMLVLMNGFSGSSASILLGAFLILLIAMLPFGGWVSRWGVQTLALRTHWSLWVCAPVTMVTTIAVVSGILFLGMILILVIGSEVFGLR
jgi:hypothetical protein